MFRIDKSFSVVTFVTEKEKIPKTVDFSIGILSAFHECAWSSIILWEKGDRYWFRILKCHVYRKQVPMATFLYWWVLHFQHMYSTLFGTAVFASSEVSDRIYRNFWYKPDTDTTIFKLCISIRYRIIFQQYQAVSTATVSDLCFKAELSTTHNVHPLIINFFVIRS